MEAYVMPILIVGVSVIVSLVGIVYVSLLRRMDEVTRITKEGLSSKVDGVEYKVKTQWQAAEYGDLKISIRELCASNDASHQAIMIELKRTNDTLRATR